MEGMIDDPSIMVSVYVHQDWPAAVEMHSLASLCTFTHVKCTYSYWIW